MRNTRKQAKTLRLYRQELVHGVGCVFDLCCMRRAVLEDDDVLAEALDKGVRIPRSIRKTSRYAQLTQQCYSGIHES